VLPYHLMSSASALTRLIGTYQAQGVRSIFKLWLSNPYSSSDASSLSKRRPTFNDS
jgi:hypothetical protein